MRLNAVRYGIHTTHKCVYGGNTNHPTSKLNEPGLLSDFVYRFVFVLLCSRSIFMRILFRFHEIIQHSVALICFLLSVIYSNTLHVCALYMANSELQNEIEYMASVCVCTVYTMHISNANTMVYNIRCI